MLRDSIALYERYGHMQECVEVVYRGALVRISIRWFLMGCFYHVDCLPTVDREDVEWLHAYGRTLPTAWKPIAAYLRGEE